MAIGLMSDLHGNRIAVEAVVADGRSRGVTEWWVLGDLVAIGPEPVATLELVSDLPGLRVTSGNTERYVLTSDRPPPSADDVRDRARAARALPAGRGLVLVDPGALAASRWTEWLDALPLETDAVLADGTRLLGVHASPGCDDGAGITPDRPDDELRAALEPATADLVCAGHTHRPTDRQVGPVRAVNLGSVSNPITDDLRASYVVIEADRHGHRVEHRRVDYDRAAFLATLERSGHPTADYIASFQHGEQRRYPSRIVGAPTVDP